MLCTALDLSRTTETAQDRRSAQRKYQEDSCTAKCCDMKFVNGVEKCLYIMNEAFVECL